MAFVEQPDQHADTGAGTAGVVPVSVPGHDSAIGAVLAALEERVRAGDELLERLGDALPVGVAAFDSALRLTFSNARLDELLGRPDAATMPELFPDLAAGDQGTFEAAMLDLFAHEPVADFQLTLGEPGALLVCSVAVRALTDAAGVVNGGVACVSEVTEQALAAQDPDEHSTTDPLTGCLNRAATWELLEHLLQPERIGPGVAVIFVDLDGFKEVNDVLGQATGDMVLVETARRLMASIREGDHIGRIGGDEFLLICRNVSSKARAKSLARRFSRALDGEFDGWGRTITLRGGAGVAWTTEPVSPERLVAQADEAMYARKAGREGFTVVSFPSQDDDCQMPRQGGGAA